MKGNLIRVYTFGNVPPFDTGKKYNDSNVL